MPSIHRVRARTEPLESRRLLSALGLLDTAFGTAGQVQLGTRNETGRIATAPDDSIYVVTVSTDTVEPPAATRLMKFTRDGQIDRTFGDNHDGTVQLDGERAPAVTAAMTRSACR